MFAPDPVSTAIPWYSIAGSALDALGGLFGGKSSGAAKEARHIQYATWQTQQDLAYNGVQRRVEDAQKAGVNPLVAMGMNPYQGGVASVVGDVGGKDSIPGTLARAGADVSRALAARGTAEERATQKALAGLALEKAGLENDLLRSQIRTMESQSAPAPVGSSNYDDIIMKDARYPTQSHMRIGYGDTAPFLVKGIAPEGHKVRVYNEDLGDNELLQLVTSLGYSLPDHAVGVLGDKLGKWLYKLQQDSARRWSKADKIYGKHNRPFYARDKYFTNQ